MKRGQGDAGFLTFVLFVIIMMLMDVKSSRGGGGRRKTKTKSKKKVVGSGFCVGKWLILWPSTH